MVSAPSGLPRIKLMLRSDEYAQKRAVVAPVALPVMAYP